MTTLKEETYKGYRIEFEVIPEPVYPDAKISARAFNSKGEFTEQSAAATKAEAFDEIKEFLDVIKGDKDINRQAEIDNYTLSSSPVKYSSDDLVEMATATEGWSIAGQLRSILDGESLGKQNSNALKYIEEFLNRKDETELADDVKRYLKLINYKPGGLGI